MELAGVDLIAVLQAEQPFRIEPGAIGLLARRVVLVGVPEGALALQAVLGRRHLADSGYHDGLFPKRPASAVMAGKSALMGRGTCSLSGPAETA